MQTTQWTSKELDATGEAALYGALRHFWHPVMYAADLGDAPQKAVLLDEQLVIVRLAGEVRAFPDRCAHRGTALSLGRVEGGDTLRCAYHGWTYGPDGACTSIPARFGCTIPPRARLHRYRVAERDGLIWVCLEDEARYPLPEFPEYNDPTHRVVTFPAYEWKCNAGRRVENYVDFAHFPWVHDGILGDSNNPEVPDHDVWREGAELRMNVSMTEPSNRKNMGSPAVAHRSYRIFMPFTIWLHNRVGEKNFFVLFMSACPVGPKSTKTFTFIARNFDLDGSDQKYIDAENLIIGQDQPITESQRPEELPVDLTAELHIRGVDKVSNEYRKWLIEIARSDLAGVNQREGRQQCL